MPVYKDKERNTWYISFRKKDINQEWKHIKKRGFPTKREAQEEEAKLKLSELDSSSSLTFFELYLDYIRYNENKLKPRTIATIKNRFENHILPYFKNKKVNDINLKQYQEWQNILNKKDYKNNYKNIIHTNIVSLFNYGIKYHNINKNIPTIVGSFKDPHELKREINFWTFEEYNKFIETVDNITYKTLFATLYFSGARIGETLALTWNDINIDKEEIYIKKSISRKIKGSSYAITTPKTKSSNRVILIPRELKKILTQYYEHQKQYEGFNNNWFLFEGINPLPETTITRNKDKYCDIAKVKKIRIHDFRHSHASLLINNGANPTIVAQRLGHSDVAMTLNTYSHMFPNSQKEIIKIINNL